MNKYNLHFACERIGSTSSSNWWIFRANAWMFVTLCQKIPAQINTSLYDDAHFMIDVIKMEIGKNVKIRYILSCWYPLQMKGGREKNVKNWNG